MVGPLLPVAGLLKGLLPFGAALIPDFLSQVGGLLGTATSDADPDFRPEDELLADIAVRDPEIRRALLKEVERRLSDDVPEDAETTARLERLRDFLRRLEDAAPVPDVAADPRPVEASPKAVALPVAFPPVAPVPVAASARGSAVAFGNAVPVGSTAPAAAAALPAPPPLASEPESVDLVERVLRVSRLAQSRGVSRLRLTISPPGLGDLQLDLSLRRHTLCGTFQALQAGAAETLRARLPALKEALEKQGFRIEEFRVTSEVAVTPAPSKAPPAVFGASPSGPRILDLQA